MGSIPVVLGILALVGLWYSRKWFKKQKPLSEQEQRAEDLEIQKRAIMLEEQNEARERAVKESRRAIERDQMKEERRKRDEKRKDEDNEH